VETSTYDIIDVEAPAYRALNRGKFDKISQSGPETNQGGTYTLKAKTLGFLPEPRTRQCRRGKPLPHQILGEGVNRGDYLPAGRQERGRGKANIIYLP